MPLGHHAALYVNQLVNEAVMTDGAPILRCSTLPASDFIFLLLPLCISIHAFVPIGPTRLLRAPLPYTAGQYTLA